MKLSVAISSILLLATWTTANKEVNVSKFTRFICYVYDKTLIANHSCNVKPINRHTSLANLEGILTRPVTAAKAHVRLFKKFTVYKPFLVNVVENFCEIFTSKYGSPYTRLLASIIAKNSNLNHSCPYDGLFYIRNLPMDTSKLKSLWPAGDYRLDINVSVNNVARPAVGLQIFLEMKEQSFK